MRETSTSNRDGRRATAASLRAAAPLLAFAGVFFSLSTGSAGARENPADPFDNVLLISVDTLRPDYLGCYGAEFVETPNIDRLAKRGVLFEMAVAPTPQTGPSHSSLFTGLTPPRHGVRDNSGFVLGEETETLAETFREAGYRTAAFIGAIPLDSQFGFDQGFEHYDDSLPVTESSVGSTTMPERRAVEVVDSALKWLAARDEEERWFVFLHLFDPHYPHVSPPLAGATGFDGEYAGEVMYVDRQLGRVFDFLERQGEEGRTLVVFTSDHGESLGEHGERSHAVFAYNSTLHVPLIVAPTKPHRIERRVRLIDIAPTILDLQGLELGEDVEGRSLAAEIRGEKAGSVSPESYFEALSMYLNMRWAPLRGFYSERFKYIELPIPELYDLESDPGETNNLCGDDGTACKRWESRFLEFAGPFEPIGERQEVSPEMRAQLEALGYLVGGQSATEDDFGPEDDPKNLIGLLNDVMAAVGLRLEIKNAVAENREGRPEEALRTLERAIEQRPTMPLPYRVMAGIYGDLGQIDRAIAALERAIAAGAGNVLLRVDLGRLLQKAGRSLEAVKVLEALESEEPDRIDVLDALAAAYFGAGRLASAQETYEQALAIDDSSAQRHLDLATVFLLKEDWTAAIAQLDRAIALDPDLARAYTGRGLAQAAAGLTDAAVESWKKALELDRTEFTAMLRLAIVYLEKQQPELAIPLLKEFEERAPADRFGDERQAVRSLLEQL